MTRLLLAGSLLAFLLFPAFLVTAAASTPVWERCPSHPNLEPGDPLDKMVVQSIEICGKFVGDPAPLKELISSKIDTTPGDRFDQGVLKNDFRAVWSLGRVHTMRVGLNKGKRGVIVVFEVEERLSSEAPASLTPAAFLTPHSPFEAR